MKFKNLLSNSIYNFYNKSSSLIYGIAALGNTPLINEFNRGVSSLTNLGVTVSQNDFNITCVSYSNEWQSKSFLSLFYSIIYLFKSPAEPNTDFNDLRPKS